MRTDHGYGNANMELLLNKKMERKLKNLKNQLKMIILFHVILYQRCQTSGKSELFRIKWWNI